LSTIVVAGMTGHEPPMRLLDEAPEDARCLTCKQHAAMMLEVEATSGQTLYFCRVCFFGMWTALKKHEAKGEPQ
jgi:hypothetical protein